ncbi:MAG TPA: kelch repeat-containing protein [Acidimicrobiales bacterium]|nr:kelch repeat-containing protein [Acidimicrobiales bacterium]
MSRPRTRTTRRLLAVLTLGVGLLSFSPPTSLRAATPAHCAAPGTDDKCEAWVATHQSEENPYDVVVGAGGRRIYTTGIGATVAFDDAGHQLWDTPFPGDHGAGYAVVVSPDDLRLYVAFETVENGARQTGTIAYDARTGRPVWAVRSLNGEFGGGDIVVSRDGQRVLVLARGCASGGPVIGCPNRDHTYVTSSLDATSGTRRWTSNYDSGKRPDGTLVDHDAPRELVLSRDGTRVFVGGLSATVAYDTSSGATLWATLEDRSDFSGVATSPDGSLVFATGLGPSGPAWLGDFVTVAYNAATGTKVWASHLPLPPDPPGTPGSMAGFAPWPCCGKGPLQMSPTGDRLYLTGMAAYYTAWPGRVDFDALTLAYEPSSGRIVWQARYRGATPNPGIDPNTDERGFFLEVAPDGSRIYMTGLSYNATDYALDNGPRDYATVAYDAADGAQRWVARYNSSATATDNTVAVGGLAVSPDGTRLYALGTVGGPHNHLTPGGERAWGLAAYDTGAGHPAPPGAWSKSGDLNASRVSHTATALADGRVLVAGGCVKGDYASEGVPCPAHTPTAEIYQPPSSPGADGSWTSVAPMTAARANHTATLLPGGQVLVAGGCAVPTDAVLCPASPTAEKFDPVIGAFAPVAPMGTARVHHSASSLAGGKVLVAGGADGSQVSAGAELYDPLTGWSNTGSLTQARYGHTATVLADGKVLVTGGADAAGAPVGTAELYNPASGTWSSAGSLVTPRFAHTATVLTSGKVLVLGGCVAANATESCPASSAAELFDPVAGTSAPTGSLEVTRAVPVAIALGDGRVLVAGGRTRSGDPLSSAELYDPAAGTWSLTDAMLEARAGSAFDLRGHTATRLADQRILVVGGAPTTTTELFKPPAVTTVSGADLSLSMTDSPDPVKANQTLTYTTTAVNAGPASASETVLTDSLPASVKFVSAATTQGTCSRSGTTLTCPLGTLSRDATATVTVVVKAGSPGLILNRASLTGRQSDPNNTNNNASASTTVTQ